MPHRGQLTPLVILGILVVLILSLALFVRVGRVSLPLAEQEKQASLPPEAQEAQAQIRSCLEDLSADGLYKIGSHGGYVEPPEDSLPLGYFLIAYGASGGKKQLPTLPQVAEELGSFLGEEMPFCLTDAGLAEKVTARSVDVRLAAGDTTTLTIAYPASLDLDGTEFTLTDPYTVSLPIRLEKVYGVAEQIADFALLHPGEVDMEQLLNHDLFVDITIITPRVLLYSIRDEQSLIQGIPFTFNMAVSKG